MKGSGKATYPAGELFLHRSPTKDIKLTTSQWLWCTRYGSKVARLRGKKNADYYHVYRTTKPIDFFLFSPNEHYDAPNYEGSRPDNHEWLNLVDELYNDNRISKDTYNEAVLAITRAGKHFEKDPTPEDTADFRWFSWTTRYEDDYNLIKTIMPVLEEANYQGVIRDIEGEREYVFMRPEDQLEEIDGSPVTGSPSNLKLQLEPDRIAYAKAVEMEKKRLMDEDLYGMPVENKVVKAIEKERGNLEGEKEMAQAAAAAAVPPAPVEAPAGGDVFKEGAEWDAANAAFDAGNGMVGHGRKRAKVTRWGFC
jgi:hypothetical protein